MPIFRRLFIIAIWCLLGLIYYRASLQHEVAKVEFDPFEIVGLVQADFEDTPFDEAKKEIKKLNRKITKTKHPDALRNKWPRENKEEFEKNGNAVPEELIEQWNKEFEIIQKAFKTLTDEVG